MKLPVDRNLGQDRDQGAEGEGIDRPPRRPGPDEAPPIPAEPGGAPGREQVNALIALFNQGRLENVLERTNALIAQFPKDIMLLNIQGGANAGLGRFDAAIESYNRALQIQPGYAEAHYNLGNALREIGDLAAAIASFDRALGIRPEFAEAHGNLGVALQEKGDLKAAIESFHHALEIRPDFAEAHNNLGRALKESGDLPAAVASFSHALEIEPGFAEAHNNLGNALRESGDLAAAIESFHRALEVHPDYAEAHNNLGVALQENADPTAAIESFNRALAINPDFAEAHSNLGNALKDTGQLTAAMESFNRAIRINPEVAEAHNNLANALKDSGEVTAAIESYHRALRIRPDYAEAHYGLGRSYQISHRYAEAMEHFRLAKYKDSESFELDCLYLLGDKSRFIEKNAELYDKKTINPLLGSLGCHAEIRYGVEIPNAFCADPIKYIYNTGIDDKDALLDAFIEAIPRFKKGVRGQSLLTHGYQTAGNIFAERHPLIRRVEAVIRSKIEDYRNFYAESQEPFITRWPESYSVEGWLVNIRSEGFLKSHIHENGWISGTLYFKVPKDLEGDQGAILFSTHGGVYPDDGKQFPEKNVRVGRGNLNLFPSSLFHHTIPFTSQEVRISLAFDVIPS